MQLYRGMDIGTAKLTEAERAGIPHHLLDIWDVTETASVSEYQRLARRAIDGIHGRGRIPVLVGGSGLYVRAPSTSSSSRHRPAVRGRLEEELAAAGPAALHARLAEADRPRPRPSCRQRPPDRPRAGGNGAVRRPFSAEMPGFESRYPVQQIGLTLPRAELDQRIDRRVAGMWRTAWSARCARWPAAAAGRTDRQPGPGLRAGAEVPGRRVDRGTGRRGDREGHPPVRPAAGILVPPRSQDHLAPRRRPGHRLPCAGRARRAAAAG